MNNISYICHTSKDVQRVQKLFFDQGYTFNGEKSCGLTTIVLLAASEMNGFYKIVLHIKHDKKDMGYDYFYHKHTPKLKHISKNRTVLDCNVLFREDKINEILGE